MIRQSGAGAGYRSQGHETGYQSGVSRSQPRGPTSSHRRRSQSADASFSSHHRRSVLADGAANTSFRGHHNLKVEPDSQSEESMVNDSNVSDDFTTRMNTSLNAQWSKHMPEDYRNIADRRNRR